MENTEKTRTTELTESGEILIDEVVRYGLKIYRENDKWKIDGYKELFLTFVEAERKAKKIGLAPKRYKYS